jgi:hypothetical protein
MAQELEIHEPSGSRFGLRPRTKSGNEDWGEAIFPCHALSYGKKEFLNAGEEGGKVVE